MPVIVDPHLPVLKSLMEENCGRFNFDNDLPQLRIGLLNLMPEKERTERDLLRILSTSAYNLKVDLIETSTYRGRHTSHEHLDRFYKPWNRVKDVNYDGFIITGAPVEEIPFEEVKYWKELEEIMDRCHCNVKSTLYICWGAMAALYHFFNVPMYLFNKKLSGVFPHYIINKKHKLFRDFDDEFNIPHSRNSYVKREDLLKCESLDLLSESHEAGVYCVAANSGKEIIVTGHVEYDLRTLDFEYRRDLKKGLNPEIPQHYFRDDDPDKEIIVRWHSHANLLFNNWINYFVAH